MYPLGTIAQEALHMMFYNLYRYPSATPGNRELLLKDILADVQPDILMVCELESEAGADALLQQSFAYTQDTFARGTFVYNRSNEQDTLQQMVYFNRRKFTLLGEYVYPTDVRDINRYTLLVNTTDADKDSLIMELFVVHLKSSTGTANVRSRFNMADTLMQVLHTIPPGRHVLVAGDMNFYNSSELAYRHFTDTVHPHPLADPLGNVSGTWQDNPAFAHMHTQATRTSRAGFGLYGAIGGMDDRFDIIFMSRHLEADSTADISYVKDSYKAYGNNGNCLNKAVNDVSCNGAYSQAFRQQLHDMSDHLPVGMTLFTPRRIGPVKQPDPDTGTGIAGRKAPVHFGIYGANMVQHRLYVQWRMDPPVTAQQTIYICNAVGNVVYTHHIHTAEAIEGLDVSGLPAGMYYIRIGEAAAPHKFVKY